MRTGSHETEGPTRLLLAQGWLRTSIMIEVGTIFIVLLIVVGVVASAVGVANLIDRRRNLSAGRDKLLEELFESLIEPELLEQTRCESPPLTGTEVSLLENLLRYFELSATSRNVLAALASRSDGMSEAELLSAVNRQLEHQRRRALPATVVRKIVMILMRADLTTNRSGKLTITDEGRLLHTILNTRSTGALPTPVFASP